MPTVNRVSSIIGSIVTALESDADLAAWGTVIYGAAFTFHEGDTAENLTVTEYDDANQNVMHELSGVQSPLHLFVCFPTSSHSGNRAGCEEYTASYHIVGMYSGADSNKLKAFDFAEATMQVLASVRDFRIKVNNISARIVEPGGRWAFDLSCETTWYFKED